MAKVAKREDVTEWIEFDGYRIGVSPNAPEVFLKQESEDEEEITL